MFLIVTDNKFSSYYNIIFYFKPFFIEHIKFKILNIIHTNPYLVNYSSNISIIFDIHKMYTYNPGSKLITFKF